MRFSGETILNLQATMQTPRTCRGHQKIPQTEFVSLAQTEYRRISYHGMLPSIQKSTSADVELARSFIDS